MEQVSTEFSQKDGLYFHLDSEIPERIFVGQGLTYQISGWAFHPAKKTRRVELWLGEKVFKMSQGLFRHDLLCCSGGPHAMNTLSEICLKGNFRSGFRCVLDFEQGLQGQDILVRIVVVLDHLQRIVAVEKKTRFLKKDEYFSPLKLRNQRNRVPLVAICMATYNPSIEAFKRQIDSIRAQTFTDWLCIICDDASQNHFASEIREVIANDDRFYFFRSDVNVNFYRNFERALALVPLEVKFIAFSDQDDYWYPDKLKRLVDAISKDHRINLIYSDMKIVRPDRTVISGSYWVHRKNYSQPLDALIIANTVTGAASLFRRELIEKVLPFPQPLSRGYHDHVVACSALAFGKIRYLPEPLYEYVQNRENVIGHCDFVTRRPSEILVYLLSLLRDLFMDRILLKSRVRTLLEIYEFDYRRLALLSRTLRLRGAKKRFSLNLFNDSFFSELLLSFCILKIRFKRLTTNWLELALWQSFLTNRLCNLWAKIAKKHMISWLGMSPEGRNKSGDHSIDFPHITGASAVNQKKGLRQR